MNSNINITDTPRKKITSNMALISPPEEVHHSFSQPSSPFRSIDRSIMDSEQFKTPKQAISFDRHPPTPNSPAVSTFDLATKFRTWAADFPNTHSPVNPDPILYPERRQSTEYKPLFEEEPHTKLHSAPAFLRQHEYISRDAKPSSLSSPEPTATSVTSESEKETEAEQVKNALINDHYKATVLPQYVQSKSKASKWSNPRQYLLPTREQYELVLDVAWQSSVVKGYNSSPKEYLKRQSEENDENRYSFAKRPKLAAVTTISKPKEIRITLASTQTPRVRKPAKKQVEKTGATEIKHRRTPVKKTKVLFSYNDIPDYAPAAETIPTDKSFRVSWTGQPLDLSNDPIRHLLHPSEIQLASKLRFPCDQYLKTKRRVFVGRVNNLIKHPNKQFCKTDAQQVGGVDVNKLSQLWEAYNSIGWFNVSHFKTHVDSVKKADTVYDPKNTKWVERKEIFGF